MQEIEIDGIIRDLRHLQEFLAVLEGKGRDGGPLRVAISLGMHTISQGCVVGQHNMLDENGKPRLFCETRYAFSLGLPELAKRMIEQNYFCWESADRNRMTNYAVIDVAPGRIHQPADGEHQVVFFYLYPASGEHADVKLVVTSCHAREVIFSRIKRRYNIHVLLRMCLFQQKRIP
ncbi:MAG: hypothetical protein RLY97_244 [Pseudomonadota bacterium]|jgi:hypothetical protein